MCVSSFLCGSRANLWPFNGCYWNWFALSIIDSQGWVLERSSHSDLLKKNSHKFTPKAPIASILRLYRSQSIVLLFIRDLFSSGICEKNELKVANICKHSCLEPLTEASFELHITQMVEDSSSYSHLGWVTKHCSMSRSQIEQPKSHGKWAGLPFYTQL